MKLREQKNQKFTECAIIVTGQWFCQCCPKPGTHTEKNNNKIL